MTPEVPPRSPGGSAGHRVCYRIGGWYVKGLDTGRHGECIWYMIGGWHVKGVDTGSHKQSLSPQAHLENAAAPRRPSAVTLGFAKP